LSSHFRGHISRSGYYFSVSRASLYSDPIAEAFDDPETFRPERYLLTEYGTKPGYDDRDFRNNLPFGCGRVRHHIHHHSHFLIFSRRESAPAFTLRRILWLIHSSFCASRLAGLTFIRQILNTLNLIWAFDFDLARDPETKEPNPVDLWDFEKVCLPHSLPFLTNASRVFSPDRDHSGARSRCAARSRPNWLIGSFMRLLRFLRNLRTGWTRRIKSGLQGIRSCDIPAFEQFLFGGGWRTQ
jgi:hypothetical protein